MTTRSYRLVSSVVCMVLFIGALSTTNHAQRKSVWRASVLPPGKALQLQRVLFQGRFGWAIPLYPGELLISDDGGASWRLIPSPDGYEGLNSVFFADSQQGWAATTRKAEDGAVLLRTTDGGRTWATWSNLRSLNIQALLDMRFSEDGTGLAVGFMMAGQLGAVLSTNDHGKNWRILTTTKSLYDLAVGPDGTIWVAGVFEKILMSPDAGKTWIDSYTKTDTFVIGFRSIAAPSGGMAVAAAELGGVIVRTIDRGKSWEHVRLPKPYEDLSLGTVRFADAQHGWAAGEKGAIFFTDDGGKTWRFEDQISGYVRDIAITEGKVVAVADSGIFWREKPNFR